MRVELEGVSVDVQQTVLGQRQVVGQVDRLVARDENGERDDAAVAR